MTPYVFNNGYIGDTYKSKASLHESIDDTDNSVVGYLQTGDVFVQVGDPVVSVNTRQNAYHTDEYNFIIKVMVVNRDTIGWLFLNKRRFSVYEAYEVDMEDSAVTS